MTSQTFSRLAASTGIQAKSRLRGPARRTMIAGNSEKRIMSRLEAARGLARIYSELLVEENSRCPRPKQKPRGVDRFTRLVVSPEPELQRKLIKDRALWSVERCLAKKAGRQGSIANRWSRRMGQPNSGLLIFLSRLKFLSLRSKTA